MATKKKSTKKKAASKKKVAKKATKKAASKKKLSKKTTKKAAIKKVTKKASVKKAATKKKVSKSEKKVETKKAAPAKKTTEKEDKRSKAAAALKAALAEAEKEQQQEEEEFDPEAFFEASGGQGIFRTHVMRKERVDLSVDVRFRIQGKALVHHAEMINLSKGGLCLRTEETFNPESKFRIEIPLPHTSELFSIQAEVVWSQRMELAESEVDQPIHTGLKFLPMNIAKKAVISNFIQQRRDEKIMSKIGLDKFGDSAPVSGID